MKTLIITRHAKSSWEHPHLSDRQRPLKTKRGKNDAKLMGEFLKKENYKADLMISSPAKRAFLTATIIAKILNYDTKNILQNEKLYFKGTNPTIQTIKNTSNDIKTLHIFGHNPDFHNLVEVLTNTSFFKYPTCATTILQFDTKKWSKINQAKLIHFITPRQLKDDF